MPNEESEANNCWIVFMIVSRSEDVMTDSARVGRCESGVEEHGGQSKVGRYRSFGL